MWIKTETKLPPNEWEGVIGWDKIRGYTIAYWFTHSSGVIIWSVNGRSGDIINPPEYWHTIPPIGD